MESTYWGDRLSSHGSVSQADPTRTDSCSSESFRRNGREFQSTILGSEPIVASMKKALKVVLVLLAIPVVFFGCVFIYGMYLAATGQEFEKPRDSVEHVSSSAPQAEPLPAIPTREFSPLPDTLDDDVALDWVVANGLIWTEAGELKHDDEAFAALSVDTASKLHHAMRAGGKEAQPMRLRFFALCGSLEVEKRAAFAEEVGAFYRPSHGATARGYIGDFAKLFWLQTRDSESVYARGVRAYAEVVTTKGLSQALIDFGAIDERVEYDSWITHVDRTMQEFDPDTLMALSDAVKLGFFDGDTKYLKRYLAELAEEKRELEAK